MSLVGIAQEFRELVRGLEVNVLYRFIVMKARSPPKSILFVRKRRDTRVSEALVSIIKCFFYLKATSLDTTECPFSQGIFRKPTPPHACSVIRMKTTRAPTLRLHNLTSNPRG